MELWIDTTILKSKFQVSFNAVCQQNSTWGVVCSIFVYFLVIYLLSLSPRIKLNAEINLCV